MPSELASDRATAPGQRGLNRLFKATTLKISSIAIELNSSRCTFNSIAIEPKIDGQRALRLNRNSIASGYTLGYVVSNLHRLLYRRYAKFLTCKIWIILNLFRILDVFKFSTVTSLVLKQLIWNLEIYVSKSWL